MVRVTCIGTWDQNVIFINWSTTKMKYDSLTSLLVLFIYLFIIIIIIIFCDEPKKNNKRKLRAE